MKNKIGIFIIFSLSFLYVNAQSVKGVVVDKKGSPLPLQMLYSYQRIQHI